MKRGVVVSLFTVLNLYMLTAQKLIIYDPPKEIYYKEHNDDFTVKVRIPGKEWKDLYEYRIQVDLDHVRDASMVYYDFEDKVEMAVRVNNLIVNSVKIRPSSLNINPSVKGNIIMFSINKPCNFSLEVNGDIYHNLHVFANSLLNYTPNLSDPDLIYFGPGLHYPEDTIKKEFIIPSDKTVFIHGGAMLRGKLVCNHVKNTRIVGRGIIDRPYRGIEITFSENISVEGLIFKNPCHYTVYGGQSKNITIRDIKSFSCEGWTDGIDLMACSDVIINHVFLRNSDDCIAIYTHRWDFYGNARNYSITNSILWADIAHPTNIGLHGNGKSVGDTIENIMFKNIDILEHDEDDQNYQGCLAISGGDNNLIRNITYENIRIEDIQEGQLFNFRIYFNEKYCTTPGRRLQNITLKNISYKGSWINPSVIDGYDNYRLVQNVTIENLRINGRKIKKPDQKYINIGEFVEGVEFY